MVGVDASRVIAVATSRVAMEKLAYADIITPNITRQPSLRYFNFQRLNKNQIKEKCNGKSMGKWL